MTARELVVLGTASQAPTRHRNHNGYLLLWDDEGFLFDPGEGTQRQMLLAGVAASRITQLCLTHFHGDHCLGVPGVVQRLSLDDVRHPVHAYYPDSGREFFARLRHASVFHERAELREVPVASDGPVADGPFGVLHTHRLDHPVDAIGYRLVEPDGHRFVPELLARHGIAGPAIGELHRSGAIRLGERVVGVEEVSTARPGQTFAFVMDTRLCPAVYALADGVDMLVIEATFLEEDAELATRFGHLTAAQAGRVAAECNVRRLVLTHFSQRYPDIARHREEALTQFDGDVVVAEDLTRIPVPARR
ncbi:ribonuclease Z [Mycobacterium sp. GA-2829]|uniref:ribonuclease Z n=1 Tax=Mycobacterium sp. GA-2829 TaxID=1772283 RepID=UPI00073FEC6B|nr:ribonuclease Z [Mycobacterium sp. GA-2829]KUI38506.1 ribonuclease Z [Mycobacterium sp. GA-2829]